jgi:hypothetical protein
MLKKKTSCLLNDRSACDFKLQIAQTMTKLGVQNYVEQLRQI